MSITQSTVSIYFTFMKLKLGLLHKTRTLMQDKQHGFIGLSIYAWWLVPLTDTKEDAIATQRAIDFQVGW